MSSKREFPERPLVGVGGVVIAGERALLIRRGSEPLKGEWSIPGGMLELGEKIADGIARELKEETGLTVGVLDFIEVFERIFPDSDTSGPPRYHFVIVDYLCERLEGEARPGSDVTDVAWVREEELGRYGVSPSATRVLKKAFTMARERAIRPR
jgi:ADP-ribose pyrophosphatase YjhB (NUDIX family)